MSEPKVLNVYQCIAAVSAEIALSGIAKTRQNNEQKYKFRGIDDVYNALAPVLSKHGLVIVPRILNRVVVERTTKSGGAIFNVVVEAEFDFVSALDGSKHTAKTFGEGMDTGDKATNKAMSAAYKYVTFQAFCIPTEGDNDADATTHEVAVKVPEGYEQWLMDLELMVPEGLDKVRAVFKDSKPEYREYRTKHDNARHEAMKTKAIAADQERAAKAAKETVAA